jgi:hypothetical protein
MKTWQIVYYETGKPHSEIHTTVKADTEDEAVQQLLERLSHSSKIQYEIKRVREN